MLSPIGLRLSEEKTDVVHIDEGLDFLGWRIQRHTKRGTAKSYVYTYPSKKALGAITGKVRRMTRQGTNLTLAELLHSLDQLLPGRRVQPHLPIPARLHLAQSDRLVAAQTPTGQLEAAPPTLLP